jgi:adenylate kinase
MDTRTIIFIGPQGSGKGTQLDMLRTALDARGETTLSFQSGNLFRALAQESSYTGRCLQSTLESGSLQPLFLTVGLWAGNMIHRMEKYAHVLIEGFPRTKTEAEILTGALAFYGRTNIEVVVLDVSDEVVRERLRKRGRGDDTDDGIQKRLNWYKEHTDAILEYFATLPGYTVHRIPAERTIDDIAHGIRTSLQIT